jgi:hypothetical protein
MKDTLQITQGTAISKCDQFYSIDNIPLIKYNDRGIISAYLPDQNIFAVYFGKNKWITFEITEQEFLSKFEIQLKNIEEEEFISFLNGK